VNGGLYNTLAYVYSGWDIAQLTEHSHEILWRLVDSAVVQAFRMERSIYESVTSTKNVCMGVRIKKRFLTRVNSKFISGVECSLQQKLPAPAHEGEAKSIFALSLASPKPVTSADWPGVLCLSAWVHISSGKRISSVRIDLLVRARQVNDQ